MASNIATAARKGGITARLEGHGIFHAHLRWQLKYVGLHYRLPLLRDGTTLVNSEQRGASLAAQQVTQSESIGKKQKTVVAAGGPGSLILRFKLQRHYTPQYHSNSL